jgi:hypothetical protein
MTVKTTSFFHCRDLPLDVLIFRNRSRSHFIDPPAPLGARARTGGARTIAITTAPPMIIGQFGGSSMIATRHENEEGAPAAHEAAALGAAEAPLAALEGASRRRRIMRNRGCLFLPKEAAPALGG